MNRLEQVIAQEIKDREFEIAKRQLEKQYMQHELSKQIQQNSKDDNTELVKAIKHFERKNQSRVDDYQRNIEGQFLDKLKNAKTEEEFKRI